MKLRSGREVCVWRSEPPLNPPLHVGDGVELGAVTYMRISLSYVVRLEAVLHPYLIILDLENIKDIAECFTDNMNSTVTEILGKARVRYKKQRRMTSLIIDAVQ